MTLEHAGLADHLWVLLHDAQTGRPLVHRTAVGVGLAAAVLADLCGEHLIEVTCEQVRVQPHQPAPTDGLDHLILDEICGQPEIGRVSDWLEVLGQARAVRLDDQIGQRLARAGYLRARYGFGRRLVFEPVNPMDALWQADRLHQDLRQWPAPMACADRFLAVMVRATSLAEHLLGWDVGDRHALDELTRAVAATLPGGLAELAALTEAMVGRTATHRRH